MQRVNVALRLKIGFSFIINYGFNMLLRSFEGKWLCIRRLELLRVPPFEVIDKLLLALIDSCLSVSDSNLGLLELIEFFSVASLEIFHLS